MVLSTAERRIIARHTRPHNGRPPLFDNTTLKPEDLERAYEITGSIDRAAKALGICKATFVKYHRRTGQLPLGTKPNPYPWLGHADHPVQQWLDKQIGAIPRSPTYIAEQVGMAKNTVVMYLRRRRDALLAYLDKFGPLTDLGNLALLDVKGRRIQLGMIEQYRIKLDQYNLLVTIHGVLKFGGRVTIRVSFQKYRELLLRGCPPTADAEVAVTQLAGPEVV